MLLGAMGIPSSRRHAEKPDDVYDPELSAAGKIRADKLATFIPSYFGAPDFIFAPAISNHSVRPYETVVPLAKAIQIFIDATFANSDYDVLAGKLLNKAKYDGSLILICWHHGKIPSLLDALSAPAGSYPDPWGEDVFNLIIQLQFDCCDNVDLVDQVTEPF